MNSITENCSIILKYNSKTVSQKLNWRITIQYSIIIHKLGNKRKKKEFLYRIPAALAELQSEQQHRHVCSMKMKTFSLLSSIFTVASLFIWKREINRKRYMRIDGEEAERRSEKKIEKRRNWVQIAPWNNDPNGGALNRNLC